MHDANIREGSGATRRLHIDTMTRSGTIAAAQLGLTERCESRAAVVRRLIDMMRQAAATKVPGGNAMRPTPLRPWPTVD